MIKFPRLTRRPAPTTDVLASLDLLAVRLISDAAQRLADAERTRATS